MPSVSKRVQEMPSSPIRKLAPLAQGAWNRGTYVLSLNIGQPDLPTPPQALEALHHIDRQVLEYSPSEGLPEFRAKLAEYYARMGMDVAPSQILVTAGGSEALRFAFLTTMDHDDEMIVIEPMYANYLAFARTAGIKLVGIPASIDNGFALPGVEEFEKRITPRTKAILICNPSNPTGSVYTPEELDRLRDLVKKYNLFLISDEVYREFCYTDIPVKSALQLEGIEEQVIVVDSVSKRYNECGIRVGNLVTRNRDVYAGAMKYAQARLSPPLLGQIVAAASIDTPRKYMAAAFAEYRRRRDFLVEGLNEIPGVYSPMPMGAFYTVARLPVENAEDFCKWCLKEFSYENATIFMAPAAGFYSSPSHGLDEVRIAYVLKEEDLALALRVLRAALDAYPGTKR